MNFLCVLRFFLSTTRPKNIYILFSALSAAGANQNERTTKKTNGKTPSAECCGCKTQTQTVPVGFNVSKCVQFEYFSNKVDPCLYLMWLLWNYFVVCLLLCHGAWIYADDFFFLFWKINVSFLLFVQKISFGFFFIIQFYSSMMDYIWLHHFLQIAWFSVLVECTMYTVQVPDTI